MNTIHCPHCREENPADCVMCWACYTPLHDQRRTVEAAQQVEPERSALQKMGRALTTHWPLLPMASLIASGWLARRARGPVLGASLVALGGVYLDQKRSQSKEKMRAEVRRELGIEQASDATAVERLAQGVLLDALKPRATLTRIEVDERGVTVTFLAGDERVGEMKIPLYMWAPLRHQLLRYVRQGEYHSSFAGCFGWDPAWTPLTLKITETSAQLQAHAGGETLELRFETAPLQDVERQLNSSVPPDVVCAICDSYNAFDAVWCWNCGATVAPASAAVLDKHTVLSAIFLGALGSLASSGWWSRPARLPALGAGSLGLVAVVTFDKWDEQRRKSKKLRAKNRVAQSKSSAAQLADNILIGRLMEGADAIRLQEHGNVVVSYQVGQKWHRGAVLPAWMWLALRERLLEMARQTTLTAGHAQAITAELSVDVSGETLLLRFDEAA